MFDRPEPEVKMSQFMQQRTAANFGETQEDSVVFEVEAEREYVQKLKVQREKIQTLYSKYDVLLRDLKNKDFQLKEKDKTISNLQVKCKNLSHAYQESSAFKQQNHQIKTENSNLQRVISQLEESYAFLHGQFKNKEATTNHKYDQMENLNDQLMNKLRVLTKRYQEREQEFDVKYKNIVTNFEEFKLQAKKARENLSEDNEVLKAGILQKDEQIKLFKTENECLKSRISELEAYINELVYENEEKVEQLQKEKKCQVRILKNEIQNMKEINYSLEKKWHKLKEDFENKEISLKEMTLVVDAQQRQSGEAIQLLKHQFAQQRSALKEQLIQCQNHIDKLERKIADLVRKQQCLYGKIKKYEVCLDAKRNLREIEQQELDKINLLLSLP